MANSLVALGVDNTPVNALGSFAEGEQAAAAAGLNKLKQASATIEMIGSGAMYALGGNPDGQVDPVKYGEVLDSFEKLGIDVGKFRDNPNFANVAAHASLGALNELQQANNERDYELIVDKWQAALTQQDFENNIATEKLAMDQAEAAGGGPDEVGLQLTYGRDADGNVVALQPTKGGKLVRSEIPEGVTVDLGVKSQESAAGREVGKVQGAAEAALATAQDTADEVADKIKVIKNDKDLGVVIGTVDANTPNLTERSRRVQAKIDQIRGVAFLQARQMLKGGGAITDYESAKAEAAYIRMEQMVSEDDFKQALDDFNTAVQAGVKKLKKQATLDRKGGGGASSFEDVTIEEIP